MLYGLPLALRKAALRCVALALMLYPGLTSFAQDAALTTSLCVERSGSPDVRADACRRALERDSANVDARLGYLGLLSTLDRLDEAVIEARALAALRPNSSVTQFALGYALSRGGHHAEAIPALRKAIALGGGGTVAQQFLCSNLAKEERFEEAMRECEKVARDRPHDAGAWAKLALGAMVLGRYAASESYWERVLIEDPAYFDDRADERKMWTTMIASAGRQRAATLAGETLTDGAVREVEQKGTSFGSGFVVSRDGHVVTNQHVVRGCGVVTVRQRHEAPMPARIIATDSTNDLALLLISASYSNVARIREMKRVRLGVEVAASGYPLPGLLADQLNLTFGSVSALAGVGNDSRYLQFTAPVQAGNSGGPLLDRSGAVVGVVVAKLDAAVVFGATSSLPENVNFAVKASTLEAFLSANGVVASRASSENRKTTTAIAELAGTLTVQIACRP